MRRSIQSSLVAMLVIVLVLGLVPVPASADMATEDSMAEAQGAPDAPGGETLPDSDESAGDPAAASPAPDGIAGAPEADPEALVPAIPPNDPRDIIEREFECEPVDEPLDSDGTASGDGLRLRARQVDEASLRALIKTTLGNRQAEPVDIEVYGVTLEELKGIYRDVVTTTYDFFYVEPTCQISYYPRTGLAVAFTPWYVNFGGENIDDVCAEFLANTAEVLSWVPHDASKLEQAKAVHDWLCWNVTYDYDSFNSGCYKWYDHNAFGALNARTCVCQGFAEAYQCLMALLDIPCTIVSAHNHAWNLIQVDGNWYHVDATWDQGFTYVSGQSISPTSTIWFMKSDDKVAAQDQRYSQSATHCDFVSDHSATDTTYDDCGDSDWTTYRAPNSLFPVSSFELSDSQLTMSALETRGLALESVSPDQTGILMAQWTSSDPAVAWVSSVGEVVSGTRLGSTEITATLGSVSRTCIVNVRASIDDVEIAAIASQTYDGSPKRPPITVTMNGRTLAVGTDYTVGYSDNVDAGTATVTVTGAGDYEGTREETFTIEPAAITSVSVQGGPFAYDGTAKKPVVSVRAGSTNVPASGYSVRYENNVDAGTAGVSVTGTGNYAGTVTAEFTIAKGRSSVAAVAVASMVTCTYSADESRELDAPNVTVSGACGGITHTNASSDVTACGFGVDRETGLVTVPSGTSAGTYEVRIRVADAGDANHEGGYAFAAYSVRVSPASIAGAALSEVPAQAHTGKAITPKPTVRLGSTTLCEGTDYTLSYENNVNPGTATITVTGRGNYAGSKSVSFTIVRTFPDVPANAWYAGVVSRAVGLGLINGYADGRFGPNDRITRGQVAVVLWNMAGGPAAGAGARDFPDVRASDYFYNAVRWASSVGVVSGYAGGRFGPNDNVTREQLAVMLANYAKQVVGKQASGSAADFASMSDTASVSTWAVPAVGWCFRSKILSGSGGKILPQGNATRAEAAKMVVGLHDLLA